LYEKDVFLWVETFQKFQINREEGVNKRLKEHEIFIQSLREGKVFEAFEQ
jgi:hypothetical protein